MRLLLALILMVPAFAQQPNQRSKPDGNAAQPGAKTDANSAQAQAAAPTSTPAPSADQWFSGSIDIGYRWLTNINGSLAEYRSVINLGEGPRLFGLDFTVLDPKKRLFDRLDARAYSWGGDPYNTAHITATKRAIYDFNFDYRNIAYFNAVPSFANPFAPGGFDQQSFDTRIRNTSVSLDLFPGRRITPYVAFDRNYNYGHGIDTFVQGADNEYPVPVRLSNGTNNYRAGVRFEFNRFHVTLEQGGTTYQDNDQTSFTGQNSGDRTTPILGQQTVLNSLQQAYGIRGSSVYTKAAGTARITSRLNLYGQFLYSQPKTDVNYQELAGGNFAVVASLLLFGGQYGIASGSAIQPHVSGNAGVEFRATDRLRIVESVSTDRQHDAGFGLFNQALFRNLSSNPGLIVATATAQNTLQVVNFTTAETDIFFDAARFTLRAGYRYLAGDATVPASLLSQTGGFESGRLRRNVALAGATFRPMQKLSVNLDYEGGISDRIYFRPSLNNYNRARARARYQVASSLVAQLTFQLLDNQNPAPDIRNDFLSMNGSAALYWTPNSTKRITAWAQYDRFAVRSSILYLSLPFFVPAISSYTQNAHTGAAAVDVILPGINGAKLTSGGSFVHSTGSRPTNFYQPLVRLSIPVQKHVYWNTEWQYYGFGETFYLYEGFRTNAFITGLRVVK